RDLEQFSARPRIWNDAVRLRRQLVLYALLFLLAQLFRHALNDRFRGLIDLLLDHCGWRILARLRFPRGLLCLRYDPLGLCVYALILKCLFFKILSVSPDLFSQCDDGLEDQVPQAISESLN